MKLTAIGYMGDMTVFVNIDREEALRRYNEQNENTEPVSVREMEVEDQFHVYDIWKRSQVEK